MNKYTQHGFIPLIALLIALLSLGGGVAAYEVHKHNQQAASETTARQETTSTTSKATEGTTKGNTKGKEDTVQSSKPSSAIGIKSSTKVEIKAKDQEGDREGDDDREEGDDDTEHGVTTSTPTPVVTPPSTTTNTTTYTLAEVKTHNSKVSCWTAVYGGVYNVTSWISQHPGGSQAILSMCGTDGTSSFDAQHGGQTRANAELATFKIGVLK